MSSTLALKGVRNGLVGHHVQNWVRAFCSSRLGLSVQLGSSVLMSFLVL